MASPRYKTVVDLSAPNWGEQILDTFAEFGFEPFDWQREAAFLVGACNEDGSPRFSSVVVSTPRQSGKSTFVKCVLRTMAVRQPLQKLYITAQTRIDALKHLENLSYSVLDESKVRLSVGSERITWQNGSTLEVVAPTPGGGHGYTIDGMVLDEVWDLQPHVLAAVIPATSARPNAQLMFCSTMGTVDSEVWNGLVARGRESVEDTESSIGYLEYSAASDTDVFDENLWPTFMPALGSTQTFESVRASRDSLPVNEFVRAFGNRVTKTVHNVFPQEWVEAAWRLIEPPERMVVAVDVNNEPPGASVSTGHMTEDGQFAVRNVEWRYGSSNWVPAFVKQLLMMRSVDGVVGDFGGPARQIFDELSVICEAERVSLVDRKPRDVASDTLFVYDSLREGTLVLSKTEPLEQAVSGAHKRPIGDMWLVSRNRMSVDASPLVSAVLAAGLCKEVSLRPKVVPKIW